MLLWNAPHCCHVPEILNALPIYVDSISYNWEALVMALTQIMWQCPCFKFETRLKYVFI